ncbi:hypothetical protein ES288_A10G271300v1 [Gossypium darwinii]|uniref:Uncharacterized protein n=2 Tax=Gossypium TaxID=3633 RepID=A0A5D2NX43_GOSTO|nr:hypothetical protein ES288_A10G271300v1 [Gossypium darwinii]TYI08003.1 hypothetical protein ES332_A10G266700v1 [Gossypium tomentosum]
MQAKELDRLIDDRWKEMEVHGEANQTLRMKLSRLKCSLKKWNKISFGNLDHRIRLIENEVEDVDKRGDISVMTEEDVNRGKKTTGELWKLNRSREILWRQKCKVDWERRP